MEDPVEHLRAAALSTLKSKRRKPVPVKPSVAIQSQKPPPAESLQLDYGLDENVGGDVTTPLKNEPPSLSQSKLPTLDDEGHSREEGEISEGEDISMTVPSILPIHQLPAPTKSEKSENLEPQDEERSATSEAPLTTSPEAVPSVIKLPTPTPTLMERISEPVYTDVKQEERGDSMVFADRVSDDVDMQHVRPGLALTQEEYDSVKVIVLDLLGWGVDFKYLFESGINKSLLYYVFNELNLRLPNDFDMTGIVLYTPEAITEAQQASASMTSPPAPNTSSLSPEIVRLPKPSLSSRLTTPPPTSVLTQAMGSPVDSDLHDMERRRRQELVARKAAAQASRKTKRSDHGKMFVITTSDGAQENDTNSLIPAETVDDFLNSLGPVQNLKLSITDNTHPLPEMKDDMEVDSTPEQKQLIESDPEKAIQRHASSDRSFSEPPPLSSEAPPTSVSSTSTTFSPVTSAFVLDTEAPPPARIQPVRRGTKRPVASDFVDFDSSPRKHNSFRHTEHINGNGQLNAIPRRVPTSTSFHNIGASRRCVIELSDSEEEGGPQSSAQQLYEESARQRKELNRQGKQILYPSPAPFKASDAMSPAALAQKESEIRKMRELIAQREEETRLRKLAMAKLQSNPGTRPSSTISNTGISLKQEDLDVVIAVAERLANNGQFTKNIRDPESATPPAEAASRASSSDFSTGFSTEIYPTGIEGARALPAQQQISQIADSTQGQDSPAVDHLEAANRTQGSFQTRPVSAEGSVDADPKPSPSTQTESETTSSARPRPDAKRPGLSEAVNEPQVQDKLSGFSDYRSPFASYPGLRDHSQRNFSISHVNSVSSSNVAFGYQNMHTKPDTLSNSSFLSVAGFPLPDLKGLKVASAIKMLDPSKSLCQYEIPGGGICRDDGCKDLHLSKVEGASTTGMVEPSYEDTAQYLFSTLPHSWLSRHHIISSSAILAALEKIKHRTHNAPLSFEGLVTQALLSLGPPPAS